MLELSSVTKAYGGVTVLHPTDLSIAQGQTTVLIGPSGCGKSTLIRLIIGLVAPDGGSVSLDGTAIETANLYELRRRFGYVIQEGGLFPHLTARGNITLMAHHLGWNSNRISSRVAELRSLTQFPEDGLDRYPVQLSGGQRQRVALMRALMLDPDILLLDEPLGALDPMIRFELQNDLKAIFQSLHKTVVLVTHDLNEAAFFGDLIVLLREGKIIQKGTIREMMDQPADPFVNRFIRAQRSQIETLGN